MLSVPSPVFRLDALTQSLQRRSRLFSQRPHPVSLGALYTIFPTSSPSLFRGALYYFPNMSSPRLFRGALDYFPNDWMSSPRLFWGALDFFSQHVFTQFLQGRSRLFSQHVLTSMPKRSRSPREITVLSSSSRAWRVLALTSSMMMRASPRRSSHTFTPRMSGQRQDSGRMEFTRVVVHAFVEFLDPRFLSTLELTCYLDRNLDLVDSKRLSGEMVPALLEEGCNFMLLTNYGSGFASRRL